MNKTDPICPLLTSDTVVGTDGKAFAGKELTFCVKEMCAWWIEDKQRCAIAAMGGRKNAN